MVSVAQRRSLTEVLGAITRSRPVPNVVLARIWLLNPATSATLPVPENARPGALPPSRRERGKPGRRAARYTRLDGAFRRFPLGVGKVGRTCETGQPLLLPGLRGDEGWIAEPQWMQRERVKTFAAHPLVFRGETLGVLAIFDTGVLGHRISTGCASSPTTQR